MEINKIAKILFAAVFASVFLEASLELSYNFGYNNAYPIVYRAGFEDGYSAGYPAGYKVALTDVRAFLQSHQVGFDWTDLGNGSYQLMISSGGSLAFSGIAEVHLNVQHYRDGVLLSDEYGAGVLTNIGKEWIEAQLTGNANATEKALFCADSNDATDPPLATWTQLPSEITANGLERALGTWTTNATTYGNWTVSVTKTWTGTQSTQLWGLCWKGYADSADNVLLCADSGPSQKNGVAGDTEVETWLVTVT